MTDLPPAVAVYQLHASLLEISPAIWRRLLIRSDTTIADLHYILRSPSTGPTPTCTAL